MMALSAMQQTAGGGVFCVRNDADVLRETTVEEGRRRNAVALGGVLKGVNFFDGIALSQHEKAIRARWIRYFQSAFRAEAATETPDDVLGFVLAQAEKGAGEGTRGAVPTLFADVYAYGSFAGVKLLWNTSDIFGIHFSPNLVSARAILP
jgi:hypothetical protein